MSLEAIKQHAAANPLRVDSVEIGDLTLYVREMDSAGMTTFLKLNEQREGESYSADITAGIIAIHLSDKHGRLEAVGPKAQESAAQTLTESLRFAEMITLFQACLTVSGLSGDEVEANEKK